MTARETHMRQTMADDDADGDGGEYFRWHALNEACENNANEITFALLQQFSPTSREEEAQGMPRPHTKAIKKKEIRRNRTALDFLKLENKLVQKEQEVNSLQEEVAEKDQEIYLLREEIFNNAEVQQQLQHQVDSIAETEIKYKKLLEYTDMVESKNRTLKSTKKKMIDLFQTVQLNIMGSRHVVLALKKRSEHLANVNMHHHVSHFTSSAVYLQQQQKHIMAKYFCLIFRQDKLNRGRIAMVQQENRHNTHNITSLKNALSDSLLKLETKELKIQMYEDSIKTFVSKLCRNCTKLGMDKEELSTQYYNLYRSCENLKSNFRVLVREYHQLYNKFEDAKITAKAIVQKDFDKKLQAILSISQGEVDTVKIKLKLILPLFLKTYVSKRTREKVARAFKIWQYRCSAMFNKNSLYFFRERSKKLQEKIGLLMHSKLHKCIFRYTFRKWRNYTTKQKSIERHKSKYNRLKRRKMFMEWKHSAAGRQCRKRAMVFCSLIMKRSALNVGFKKWAFKVKLSKLLRRVFSKNNRRSLSLALSILQNSAARKRRIKLAHLRLLARARHRSKRNTIFVWKDWTARKLRRYHGAFGLLKTISKRLLVGAFEMWKRNTRIKYNFDRMLKRKGRRVIFDMFETWKTNAKFQFARGKCLKLLFVNKQKALLSHALCLWKLKDVREMFGGYQNDQALRASNLFRKFSDFRVALNCLRSWQHTTATQRKKMNVLNKASLRFSWRTTRNALQHWGNVTKAAKLYTIGLNIVSSKIQNMLKKRAFAFWLSNVRSIGVFSTYKNASLKRFVTSLYYLQKVKTSERLNRYFQRWHKRSDRETKQQRIFLHIFICIKRNVCRSAFQKWGDWNNTLSREEYFQSLAVLHRDAANRSRRATKILAYFSAWYQYYQRCLLRKKALGFVVKGSQRGIRRSAFVKWKHAVRHRLVYLKLKTKTQTKSLTNRFAKWRKYVHIANLKHLYVRTIMNRKDMALKTLSYRKWKKMMKVTRDKEKRITLILAQQFRRRQYIALRSWKRNVDMIHAASRYKCTRNKILEKCIFHQQTCILQRMFRLWRNDYTKKRSATKNIVIFGSRCRRQTKALAVRRWKEAMYISVKKERTELQTYLLHLQAKLVAQKAFYNWAVCCYKSRRKMPHPHVGKRPVKEVPRVWR